MSTNKPKLIAYCSVITQIYKIRHTTPYKGRNRLLLIIEYSPSLASIWPQKTSQHAYRIIGEDISIIQHTHTAYAGWQQYIQQ